MIRITRQNYSFTITPLKVMTGEEFQKELLEKWKEIGWALFPMWKIGHKTYSFKGAKLKRADRLRDCKIWDADGNLLTLRYRPGDYVLLQGYITVSPHENRIVKIDKVITDSNKTTIHWGNKLFAHNSQIGRESVVLRFIPGDVVLFSSGEIDKVVSVTKDYTETTKGMIPRTHLKYWSMRLVQRQE